MILISVSAMAHSTETFCSARNVRRNAALFVIVASAAWSCSSPTHPSSSPPLSAAKAACGTAAGGPVQHVVWIWMENRDYEEVIGSPQAPYENLLVAQCGLATNYQAVAKPSLPNYIAAVSGSTQGIADNNPPGSHTLSVPSLFSQLKQSGREWRDYEESAPGTCPQDSNGQYAVKHDPAPYFVNIASDCRNWDVPMGSLASGSLADDLRAGALPTFATVTPNLCNDTHDCSVTTGDQWLASWVPAILAAPNYQAGNTAIFIVWDEASSGTHVPAIVISPSTAAGATSATRFDHYSLLKTTEQLVGLQAELGNASAATSMLPAFFAGR